MADAQHLPQGRCQAGDRHLNFHETRDNLIAVVARELGVNEGTLGNWVTVDRRRRDGGDAALSEPERVELARLRREVAELRMERDVLKRSVALWVKEAMSR